MCTLYHSRLLHSSAVLSFYSVFLFLRLHWPPDRLAPVCKETDSQKTTEVSRREGLFAKTCNKKRELKETSVFTFHKSIALLSFCITDCTLLRRWHTYLRSCTKRFSQQLVFLLFLQLVTSSLDVLETIGKKTFETLTVAEKQPGGTLGRRRIVFTSEKPNLSKVG